MFSDRIDRIAIPIVAGAILTIGIAIESEPEVIPGKAHAESSSYFRPSNGASAQPMNPLPFPEWGASESPFGSPPVHWNDWEVFFEDGSIQYQATNGNVYWYYRTYDV